MLYAGLSDEEGSEYDSEDPENNTNNYLCHYQNVQ
jgi:hypothetical protein